MMNYKIVSTDDIEALAVDVMCLESGWRDKVWCEEDDSCVFRNRQINYSKY